MDNIEELMDIRPVPPSLKQTRSSRMMELTFHFSFLLLSCFLYVVFGCDRKVGPFGSTIERLAEDLGLYITSHRIHTKDGYELVLHRLTRKGENCTRSRQPVLLMHGLLECSIVWLAYREKSLAYALLQEGFDVWLGNNRGNSYSSSNWGLWGEKSQAYEFKHISEGDFPAKVEFILQYTGATSLHYIGQSQGAAQAIAGISQFPHFASKIDSLIMLAPVEALALRKPKNPAVAFIMNKIPGIGYRLVFPLIALAQCIIPHFLLLPFSMKVMVAMGWMKQGMDYETSAIIFRNTPSSGTSVSNMMHWINLGVSGEQLEINTSAITCSIHCFVGNEDDVVDPERTEALVKSFPNIEGFHRFDNYAHVDFVYSITAPRIIYPRIVETLKKG